MKLKAVLLSCTLAVFTTLNAQWVLIPDTNFVHWLDTSGFHNCLNGQMLDTTCPTVVGTNLLIVDSNARVRNFTGIQYFDNLKHWAFRGNGTNYIPAFPPLLETIDALGNNLTALPPLPQNLTYLSCRSNQITVLPTLPANLQSLDCIDNLLTQLPALPQSLTALECGINQINSLPSLPVGLQILYCNSNNISNLPALPNSLLNLDCSVNVINNLPQLPASLKNIDCGYNLLTSVPVLPAGLQSFVCDVNHLAYLPELPTSLTKLICDYNNLTYLPELPDSLFELDCRLNADLHCLPQLKRIVNLYFDSLVIGCLPNYGNVTNSSPAMANVPLCGLVNEHNCTSFANISGKAFFDLNTNCWPDVTEVGVPNIKIALLQNGLIKQQTYTGGEGYYSFQADGANYIVNADATGSLYELTCTTDGNHVINLTGNNGDYDNHYSLTCLNQGYDVGVSAIVRDSGLLRPANYALIKVMAGDMSNYYNAQCAAGHSGVVQITYNGPASYRGVASGAIAPTAVSGNTLIWNIDDFANTDYSKSFNLRFHIDTLAQPHQFIQFKVTVTTNGNDVNTDNNNYTSAVEVIVPYDPNIKEVYPPDAIDVSQDWLTYTIHFQNTGTAEAQHIHVDDTLDNSIDAGSFQLLAYSHQPVVQLKENYLRFYYPNINLPDSNTNEPPSHGYVQYRVKLKPNQPIGTVISNTAHIYFDFNAAVVTNTTSNTIVSDTLTSVEDISVSDIMLRIIPNPASGDVVISTSANLLNSEIHIYDMTGRSIYSGRQILTNTTIATDSWANGIYLLSLHSGQEVVTKRLVISH